MKNNNKPDMSPLGVGQAFKTLQVNAKSGVQMPVHHATEEAVIIVKTGEVILKTTDDDHVLTIGDVFILPKAQEHSLEVKTDFQAVVVLPVNAEIEFPKETNV